MNSMHACEEEKERGFTVMATESDTHRWEVKGSMWEYAQNVTTRSAPVPIAFEEKHSDEKVAIEQNSSENEKVEIFLKSSLKKPREMDSEQVPKGNVKWMDLLGKELAEIKEFETV
ncbi:hypothetical protein BHM03_00041500 [Ensete ventricosum]|nr:hypothetical protein BHM03_00041500 [Ensete ventricosum]